MMQVRELLGKECAQGVGGRWQEMKRQQKQSAGSCSLQKSIFTSYILWSNRYSTSTHIGIYIQMQTERLSNQTPDTQDIGLSWW